MAAASSSVRSKSKTAKFSAMRCGLVDFGMTERPSCRCQRSITWAGVSAMGLGYPADHRVVEGAAVLPSR